MARKGWTCLLLAAAVLLVGGNALAQSVDLGPYFNLEAGNRLLYLGLESDGQGGLVPGGAIAYTVVELGDGLKGGLYLDAPGWEPSELILWQEHQDGHYLVADYDLEAGESMVTYPPVGPVDGVMEVGQTRELQWWEFVNGQYSGHIEIDMTLQAAGFSYETPAGAFEDCALITLDEYEDGAFIEREVWILAREVGFVSTVVLVWGGPAQGLVPENGELLVQVLGGVE